MLWEDTMVESIYQGSEKVNKASISEQYENKFWELF